MRSDRQGLRRRKAERDGRHAELFAALFLRLKGYRIIALRYRTPVGEIDIIARKGSLVAFVEVKLRRSSGEAVDAVGLATQQRIRAAGNRWLMQQRDAHLLSLRFDIIAMQQWTLPRHFVDAF
ncbi:YraN family protein [Rhizobium sp. SSA_523]|uniref:YraN family protein n=1 Tax=Rhizobium sp. SSA_523 TaxID=2952477 RepID=UPI0020909B9D|nr:YraN family protein [Rhizobium sp. SSA_523]MCO5732700.1 YraN family protein [Rhizobium sp. SSA_523]WKC25796.1 YraN family protein [Rhizobium sp. SSA_523]